MVRSAWILILAAILLAATPERAAAVPFTEDIASRFGAQVPNTIQMSLPLGGLTTFSLSAPVMLLDQGATWSYVVFNGGYSATLSTPTDANTFSPLPILWTQGFEQTSYEQTTLTWLEIRNGVTINPPRTMSIEGVVPEPSTLLILGLGALGAAVHGRRRRTSAAGAT
ncbi:MAG: PEP-CTERM sorting domain-containing protein [Planctomycetes bacterium]|nr:PEP-CTERM sorting domain-containing protein [Planctomycetota bacterium]